MQILIDLHLSIQPLKPLIYTGMGLVSLASLIIVIK